MYQHRLDDILKTSGFQDIQPVYCWVRTCRRSKDKTFLTVYDGSTAEDVQIVFRGRVTLAIHQSVRIVCRWSIRWKSWFKLPCYELVTDDIEYTQIPKDDRSVYPIPKAALPAAKLRQLEDHRVRTKTMQDIYKTSDILAQATHDFFRMHGFQWVRTPILTDEDCEGAGEMFEIKDSEDFFGRPMSLTVSGQLDLEKQVIGGLGRGYTFGPTFRAEKSHTRRHLAEFWMVEPELVIDSLDRLMTLAEDYILHCVHAVNSSIPLDARFARVSYTEAVKYLQSTGLWPELKWGDDLGSEQEMKVCEHYGGPVIVHHYPRSLKSFYMRDTRTDEIEGRETVECMDILLPGVGELVGGSMREENFERLVGKMEALDMDLDLYESYLDTRRRVSVPHGGFGLGFERLVQAVSGAEHIRDTIPYPRLHSA